MESLANDLKNLKYQTRNMDLETGLEYIEQLLLKYPNNGLVLLKKAEFKNRNNDYIEAIEIYNYIISTNNGAVRAFAMRDLFKIYIEKNMISEASKLFEQFETIEIDKNFCLAYKATLARCKENITEACYLMATAIKKAYNCDDTYLLDYCLEETFKFYTDDFKREHSTILKQSIQKVYAKVNGKSKARLNIFLAEIEFANGNFQESINLYRDALNYKHNWVRGHSIIGVCKVYLAMGNKNILNTVEFEELKRYDFQEAYYLLAEIYSTYGKYEEALKTIEKAPNNLRMLFEKAKIYGIYGKYEEALELYKYCFEKANFIIFKYSSLFAIINLYLRFDETEKAYQLLKQNSNGLKDVNKHLYFQIYAYLSKKMNFDYDITEYDSYSIQQILNYSFDKTCINMEKHRSEFEETINFEGDFASLLEYLKTKLNTKVYTVTSFFDVYNVKYDGKQDNFYIRVVVLPNTNNIVTCFPTNKMNMMMKDLNDIEEEPKQKIIKRKTQIEKFNEKYKIS